ncbi:hypothetical protein RAB80_017961 [Fusarium oxysporum f. sp. vasinfectum]|nr:hypothetical protein RAB80_017961 [Fusarium oxysporum f. sp. vasinfectum]
MEVVTMPNGHTPEEAIWDELTIYGASTPSYSRWEFSESIVPPAFLGAVQVEVDTTTLPRQDYFPKDQLLFHEESNSGYNWGDTYSTIKDQSLSPERLVMICEEPPSALIPSLPSSKELDKKPSRKRKAQLGEPKTPKSARFNARGDINKNDQRRKRIVADGNGIDVSNGITNRKNAKQKQVQERNRSSAKECRKKKKEDLMRLQSDEQAMEQRHRMLSSCVEDLKEEVLYFKTQLLQHSSCECTPIRHYIEKEAQRYVDTLGLR